MEKIKVFFSKIKTSLLWRRIFFIFLSLIIVGGLFVGLLAVGGNFYQQRVLPNTKLGQINIGGMSADELKQFLERMSDKLMNEGLQFVYDNGETKENIVIYPAFVAEDNLAELVNFDINKEVVRLISYRKDNNILLVGWRALRSLVSSSVLLTAQNITLDELRLRQMLAAKLLAKQEPPVDANVKITSLATFDFIITSSTPGILFDYDGAMKQVADNWSMLKNDTVNLQVEKKKALITKEIVEGMVDKLPKIFSADGLQLTYRDTRTNLETSWRITAEQIASWLEVQEQDKSFVFGLKKELVIDYLKSKVAKQVNVNAKDAKFKTNEAGLVVEFQGSRPGVALNEERTYTAINDAIIARSWHEEGLPKSVVLVVDTVEPNVKTGDVNNLGISEVLGVGVSSFAGSPINRTKNIRAAVNKLNGVLINPGEEFSAIKFLSPITIEGGYLPELVIKGDEIKPEVGGGLCQVGTTLFRMAMNSGMKITNRRNHSLVVNYYNDLLNNNPGTDATVYDPAPDFKFLNDTKNAILIQTEMDSVNQKLYFTIWGTTDGRQGSYSPPVVNRWLSIGEKKTIETDKLKPGVKQCQHAYRGADTAFTYTREFFDGTKENVLFESHYRSLPEICLIGVEKKSVCVEGVDCPLNNVATSTAGVLSEG